MIDIENLCGLEDYRNAARFFLVFINRKEFVDDDEAISIVIEAIVFSQTHFDQNYGSIFSFTINNVRKIFSRWLYSSRKEATLHSPIASYNKETPFSILIQKEFGERVLEIINKLPPIKRKCVTMFYENNYTYTEIAKIINVTPQAISLMFKSVRPHFKEIYAELNNGE